MVICGLLAAGAINLEAIMASEKRPRALKFDSVSMEGSSSGSPDSKKRKQIRVWVDGW